jgi:hypothetical protein
VNARNRRRLAAVLLIPVALGCSSPAATVAKEMETARSWMATTERVAAHWADNRVPSRYAERSLGEALTALRDADRRLGQAKASRDIAAAARAHIARARAATESLLSAITATNRAATPAAIALLVPERQALDSLIENAGSQ